MAREKQEDPIILNIQEQQQKQKKQSGVSAIKCPRCNSCNTKFCYYNNYSLSQPRHLCKACKRYWTRGGTLRNVPPVGGGGGGSSNPRRRRRRKNKTTLNITNNPIITLNQQPTDDYHINHVDNPLFINSLQPTNPDLQVLSFPFSSCRFVSTTRVSSGSDDQQPEMNGFGIGFSSGFNMGSDHDTQNDYFPGLMPNYNYQHILPGGLINGGIFSNLERQNMTNIHHNSSLLWSTNTSASCFQLDP